MSQHIHTVSDTSTATWQCPLKLLALLSSEAVDTGAVEVACKSAEVKELTSVLGCMAVTAVQAIERDNFCCRGCSGRGRGWWGRTGG